MNRQDVFQKTLEKRVELIKKHNTTVDQIKDIVCAFFQEGCHPDCVGCEQEEEKVRECAKLYTDNILERPAASWTPAFSEVRARKEEEKVNVRNAGQLTMMCDTCYIKDTCSLFKRNSTCAIDWATDESNLSSTTNGMDFLIRLQFERVEKARAFEQMDGGMPDANLTEQIRILSELLQQRSDMDSVKIKQTTTVQLPGSASTESKANVLAQFFGNKNKPQQQALPENTPAAPTIDVSAEVVTTKPLQIKENK
jgi:hypothetical protein